MTKTLTGDPNVSEHPPPLPQPGKLVRCVLRANPANVNLPADQVGLVMGYHEKWGTIQVLWPNGKMGWYNKRELAEIIE